MRIATLTGVVGLVSSLVALVGATPTAAAPPEALSATPPGLVDGATARRLVAAGAVVVDVRTPEEFAAGHVEGARNIPFDEILLRAPEIGPPRTPVVVYCKTGRRSALAAADLRNLGYARTWDLQRYDAWPRARR